MSNSSIWVLVANERNAAICANSDGESQLLREVTPGSVPSESADQAKRAFARELMSELCQGAKTDAYDGVIIVAGQDMLEELRRVTMPAVRKFLIAEIVGTPDWSMAQ